MKTATVLLSGGMDSTVLLHHVIKNLHYETVYVLSFNYGQRHNRELEAATWQAKLFEEVKEHRIIDISFFADLLDGAAALLQGGGKIPDLQDLAEEERKQPPTYVPNRNMMLLSLAASYAEARKCSNVFYGAQVQDEYGYWDCTLEFIERINRVLKLNRSEPVTIIAPFVKMKKAEEVVLGLELGVDFSKTWTCYRGREHPCGTCPTCVERANAFEAAGIEDPLK